ncbi:ACSF3 [Symbiodinium natans]|uniref:ACSF3 protein n=1 Tax=Symbiodinium natans TaxID=878477 RepID=A0A812SMR8_9DINO|nr:ACSF3 [Symbiodinium natans]
MESLEASARSFALLDHSESALLERAESLDRFRYFAGDLVYHISHLSVLQDSAVNLTGALKDHAQAGQPLAVLEHTKADAVSCLWLLSEGNVHAISGSIRTVLSKKSASLPRHVAFFVHPSAAYVVTELSIWAADGVCVPLSVHSPVPELEYFVKDSESCLCLSDASGAPKMKEVAGKLSRPFAEITKAPESSKVYRLLVDGGIAASCGSFCAPPQIKSFFACVGLHVKALKGLGFRAVRNERPFRFHVQPSCFACFCGLFSSRSDARFPVLSQNALILYTSGTTGQPKGVVHTFNSLTAQMRSLSEAWKWSSKDRTLHVLPLHHIHGVQNILNTALFNGAGVELTAFDAAFCLKRLTSGDITCFHAVPTVYARPGLILKQADECIWSPAQQLCPQGAQNVLNGSRYGMTEIGMALSNRINGTRYPGCVGWPLPGVEVKQDQEGGILVKGAAVFKEYYKREEATAKEFTEDGFFRTGDNAQKGGSGEELQALQDDARAVESSTGRPRPDTAAAPDPALAAIYRILGRTSVDIIKSGGYKISGLEIESVLLQHEKIRECAVVGKPDETWGEKVTAVCVLQSGVALTIKELRDWGKERMASYKAKERSEYGVVWKIWFGNVPP